ncbi:MAG: hypothetical protein V4732_00235 [Pseudomonadota bacterium]
MTLNTTTPVSAATPLSVAEIEKQIAKVNAELEKARALEYTVAEKTLLAAQKSAALAKVKVEQILEKMSAAPTAESRLVLAKAALAEKESAMTVAATQFNKVKTQQAATQKFKKKVKSLLSNKKLSKKVKFSRKEKAALKAFRRLERAKTRLAKETEKTTGQLSAQEHHPDTSLIQANQH